MADLPNLAKLKLDCKTIVFSLRPRFYTRSDLSFEYGPSLAFAKKSTVLQSKLKPINSHLDDFHYIL